LLHVKVRAGELREHLDLGVGELLGDAIWQLGLIALWRAEVLQAAVGAPVVEHGVGHAVAGHREVDLLGRDGDEGADARLVDDHRVAADDAVGGARPFTRPGNFWTVEWPSLSVMTAEVPSHWRLAVVGLGLVLTTIQVRVSP